MIPQEFYSENKRVKWDFFLKEGNPGYPGPDETFTEVLERWLPGSVVKQANDDIPLEWFNALERGWNIWAVPDSKVPSQRTNGTLVDYRFECEDDAAFFRLRWGGMSI